MKEENWIPEVLSDSDTSTGYKQSMKALGGMNPGTLKYNRKSSSNTTVKVEGGE